MKKWPLLFIFILSIPLISAYNNIYEFDENEDVIITTTVYNLSGMVCSSCTCNITVYNPAPNENVENVSVLMANKGEGIYSTNLTQYKNFSFNTNIYPFSIVCNDSTGAFGGDDREGFKIGETLFDYTSIIIALLGIGVGLMFASFKIDRKFWELQLLSFFSSFPFFIGAMFTALEIVKHSPDNANFILIYDILFWAMSVITIAFYYLRFKILMADRIKANFTK
jgi:hypothetical protein